MLIVKLSADSNCKRVQKYNLRQILFDLFSNGHYFDFFLGLTFYVSNMGRQGSWDKIFSYDILFLKSCNMLELLLYFIHCSWNNWFWTSSWAQSTLTGWFTNFQIITVFILLQFVPGGAHSHLGSPPSCFSCTHLIFIFLFYLFCIVAI